jgi:hypothetical protein
MNLKCKASISTKIGGALVTSGSNSLSLTKNYGLSKDRYYDCFVQNRRSCNGLY